MKPTVVWLEIPAGVEPDWAAAHAAVDSMGAEQFKQFARTRGAIRTALLRLRAAWEGQDVHAAVLECTFSRVLVSWGDELGEALKLCIAAGIDAELGFGDVTDHVVAQHAKEAAASLRRACSQHKFISNTAVQAWADDYEEGRAT